LGEKKRKKRYTVPIIGWISEEGPQNGPSRRTDASPHPISEYNCCSISVAPEVVVEGLKQYLQVRGTTAAPTTSSISGTNSPPVQVLTSTGQSIKQRERVLRESTGSHFHPTSISHHL
jgi:hypothetical protein